MDRRPSAPPEFSLKRQLGAGAFSRVWLAQHVVLRKDVAIKIVSKSDLRDAKTKERLEREIEIHKRMQHPYIASLFHVTENVLQYFLVMEYVPGGSLLDRVSAAGRLSENDARHYFRQLLSAVTYLHKRLHIAHRDLKCENVMLDAGNNVRIIDFGFSKAFNEDLMRTNCGSPRYAAPEMFRPGPYTEAVDVWSLGVILYVCVCGMFPFESQNMRDLGHFVSTADPSYPEYLTPSVVDLLRGMLMKNPSARMTVDDVAAQQWVGGAAPVIDDIIFGNDDTLETKILKRENATRRLAGELPRALPSAAKKTSQGSGTSVIERLCATGKFRLAQKKETENIRAAACVKQASRDIC